MEGKDKREELESVSEARFNSQHRHSGLQVPVTTVTGYLIPSFGLSGHLVHFWYTNIHAC